MVAELASAFSHFTPGEHQSHGSSFGAAALTVRVLTVEKINAYLARVAPHPTIPRMHLLAEICKRASNTEKLRFVAFQRFNETTVRTSEVPKFARYERAFSEPPPFEPILSAHGGGATLHRR
jgi:hypothetical protein